MGQMWRKALIITLALAAFIVVASLVYHFILRPSETWAISTEIGGENAEVSITYTRNLRIVFSRLGGIGGGNPEYETNVRFQNGNSLCFKTKERPFAIWRLGELYYIPCYGYGGSGWLVYRVDVTGKLVRVLRAELPEGPRPWNFSNDPEGASNLEKDFEGAAK